MNVSHGQHTTGLHFWPPANNTAIGAHQPSFSCHPTWVKIRERKSDDLVWFAAFVSPNLCFLRCYPLSELS